MMTVLSLVITVFQISCTKTANAQQSNYILQPATSTTLGGVIIGNGLNVTSNGTLSVTATGLTQLNKLLIYDGQNIAIINYDGTGKISIPINLPTGRVFRSTTPVAHLSPDGQKIFFEVYESNTSTYFIYSCSVTGNSLQVIASSVNKPVDLLGVN